MKVLRYMIKGIFPIAWFLFLTMLACHICIIDGEIDWLRVMLVYGIPYGIPYMIFYVPRWAGISGGIAVLAVEAIIGALFGFVIAITAVIKAFIYAIGTPIQALRKRNL